MLVRIHLWMFIAGVEVLNCAMEKVYAQVPPEKWVFVNVAIAPSTITISEYGVSIAPFAKLSIVITWSYVQIRILLQNLLRLIYNMTSLCEVFNSQFAHW